MHSDGTEQRTAIGRVISKSVALKLRNVANTIKPDTIPASAASGGAIKFSDRIAAAIEMRLGIVKCGQIGIGSPDAIRRFCISWYPTPNAIEIPISATCALGFIGEVTCVSNKESLTGG